jgi:predicted enzyme related to lactoylglutathione lyase
MSSSEVVQQGDISFVSLMVSDRNKAMAFYPQALGWQLSTIESPEWGEEVEVDGTSVQHGLDGGAPNPTLFLCYTVDDVKAAVDAVVDGGGIAKGTPAEEDGGLTCGCVDPLGVHFTLYEFLKPRTPRATTAPRIPGDLVGAIVESPDPAQTMAFYSGVLGWSGSCGDDGSVAGVHPYLRIVQSTTGTHRALPIYGVRDLAATADAIGRAGGSAVVNESGELDCRDDQGTRFVCVAQ